VEASFDCAVDTSKLSSMPVGGATVLLTLFPYQPSTSDPSTLVVSDGAAISLVFALYCPSSGPSGEARLTPPNAVMPAVAPTDDENRHVYEEGSNPEMTLA
jgi:hypothetical protein